MAGLDLNYKVPESIPNIFHDKLDQLIELANRKTPDHPKKTSTSTSIVRQGRLMKALNSFLRREPSVPSDVLAKAIAKYCLINQHSLLPKEKTNAEKAIVKLKIQQLQKHPKSQKTIEKHFETYLGMMKQVIPSGESSPAHTLFRRKKSF